MGSLAACTGVHFHPNIQEPHILRAKTEGGEALGGAAAWQSRPQGACQGHFRQLHAELPQGIHPSARVIIINHHPAKISPITIYCNTIAKLADGLEYFYRFFTHSPWQLSGIALPEILTNMSASYRSYSL